MPRLHTSQAGILRLYQPFLWLYPAEFRDEYRRELCLAFVDRWREERSTTGLLFVWLHAILGIFYHAPMEHCHMIIHDLRYAFRILRKDLSVTVAAILILALGIGSTTLVFSLANGLLLRPLPYPQPERIIAVTESSPTDPNETTQISFPNYFDMRARARLLDDLGVYAADQSAVRGEGAAERISSARVTDGIFRVLGVEPLLGRTFSREDDVPSGPKVVVLSEELWQRRYGRDPHVLGRTLQIDDSRWTVVGVMPAGFHFSDRADLWFPLQMDPLKAPRTDYFLRAVARLKPGVSVEQASGELESMLEQIHRENPAVNNNWVAHAIPLRDSVAGSYRKAVITLLVAVGLLLLIACANVCNLFLVKASARAREIAVRTALGATRRRLLRQLITESLLLGLAGGALGVVLAYGGIPALLSLIPVDLPLWMNFTPDSRVLGFAVGVSLHPLELKDMTFINYVVVTPGYFRTLAIPLLQGRDFTEDDFDAPRIVIVSKSFAKKNWPTKAPSASASASARLKTTSL